ncbi:MAG: aspartate carbamoyltransferase [Candidatus Doudnabacteria bacterium]|nr:aspartate carbamoyltransferase [Candidatus Doudnabacteria bacterium]
MYQNELVLEALNEKDRYVCFIFRFGKWLHYENVIDPVVTGTHLTETEATAWLAQIWSRDFRQELSTAEAKRKLFCWKNKPRHVLRSQQFDREFLEKYLFCESNRIQVLMAQRGGRESLRQTCRHRILLTHFYEPSTRTRLSFEFAALHLGMHVLTTENAAEFSSAIKGESAEDTIRILSGYHPDAIVVRHKQDGIIDRMARFSSVPLINGGEGTVQHPTQALLDVYTIFSEKKQIDGLTVVFGGDLKYGRTVRSLAYLLSKFDGVKLVFVSHPAFKMGEDLKDHLRERKVEFEETESVNNALRQADVVYWTRVQKERMSEDLAKESEKIISRFTIGREELRNMKQDAILMHPLPRLREIRSDADLDPRSAYFRQAENGLYVRMALLQWVTEPEID